MSEALEAFLKSGDVDGFNAARGTRRRVEMFAADLAAVQIAGADLSGVYLEKSDLTGADLSQANLTRADLSGIDGAEVVLVYAIAVGAKLKEAQLDGADLTGADVSHADLADAVLTGTRGEGIRLISSRLRDADCTGAHWPNADLTEARFAKAKFVGADLTNAILVEAVGNEADFTHATLDGATCSRGKFELAKFIGASLQNAKFDGADLSKADLRDANLEGADLRRANLTGAVLEGARLKGAIFSDAVLDGVNLRGLDLSGVDMSGVDARTLGLSDDQVGKMAAVGTVAPANAAIRVAEPSCARVGGIAAVVWENHDTDEQLSLRWAVFDADGEAQSGLLPVHADGVLARTIAPWLDGFIVVLLQERPGGAAVLAFELSAEGVLGQQHALPLGYDPGVRPAVHAEGDALWLWGLATRGPTLVVQKLSPGFGGPQLEVVASEKVGTAKGFLGGVAPVLWCKGGVVVPCAQSGSKPPLRAPEGFNTRIAVTATLADGRTLVAWSEETSDDEDSGGVRVAFLGGKGNPQIEAIATGHDVSALDVRVDSKGAHLAWIDDMGAAFVIDLPDGSPRKIDTHTDDEFDEIRFFVERPGESGDVLLALVTVDERLMVVDLDGHPRGLLAG